ncbi:hypothetical protein SAMN06296036_108120 [Pseudobacteriovorax antillogorgiicola]|uniref:Uncharacterized protein n=1 Tax=Pseudobacteriovorax antillogorgiicola TaxID=1513793 RepID=A0A1Y6BXJ2_9BACT|nr:hypothetical protein EDD56_108127 [Pseudobacteriovorax antillogorgiicola]SMF26163.1 hypothetical protein SAMN06296036_108120 [Pseudobacteriovorax antillogorgiicola]
MNGVLRNHLTAPSNHYNINNLQPIPRSDILGETHCSDEHHPNSGHSNDSPYRLAKAHWLLQNHS